MKTSFKRFREKAVKNVHGLVDEIELYIIQSEFSCAFFIAQNFLYDPIFSQNDPFKKIIITSHNSKSLITDEFWQKATIEERVKAYMIAFFGRLFRNERQNRQQINTLLFALNSKQSLIQEALASINIHPIESSPSYHDGTPVQLYLIHPHELDYDLILEVLGG